VVGGLITSTLLTLFVVPVMYTFLDDLGSWVTARLSSAPHRSARDGVPGLVPEPSTGD
jgi:HAE1 family hydrophobic/amphiphilic exporter-1